MSSLDAAYALALYERGKTFAEIARECFQGKRSETDVERAVLAFVAELGKQEPKH